MQVPSYYALILRSLVVLEGLALSADQEYKLLAKAYPYMARRLLTDPQPELRETFKELMLKDGGFRWNRLINLLNESSKSQDTDTSKLWLIAEWFFSGEAKEIREHVVEVHISLFLLVMARYHDACTFWTTAYQKRHRPYDSI